MPNPSNTTVTESAKPMPRPKVVMSPPEVKSQAMPPSTVLTKESAVVQPIPDVAPDAQDESYLQCVVDNAQPPCTVVVRSESDYGTVTRMVSQKDGEYHVRVNPKQEARAVWRKRTG